MRNVNNSSISTQKSMTFSFILTMRNVNTIGLALGSSLIPSFILTMRNVNKAKALYSKTLKLVLY